MALAPACSGANPDPAAPDNSGRRGDSRSKTQISPRELVERSKPAIVRIRVEGRTGAGFGTGFVIRDDGRIVTNLHVIGGADSVAVTLVDGTELSLEKVIAYDAERDLAIIAVRTGAKLPTLSLGDSDAVSAGDPVVAIGNPLGVLDYSVSDGLISAVRPLSESLTVLQISAPISQGSSGGPLFNSYGEVIGVATAIVGQGQNLNFGIPSNYVRPLLGNESGVSLAALTAELEQRYEAVGGSGQPRVQRNVPNHDVAVLDGCSDETVQTVVESIGDAISNGAPLYNAGNHEACYRIYEGAAMRLEQAIQCKGVRQALGQGLLRASTQPSYSLKAWAMRDAFDGILRVVERRNATKSP